MIKHLVCVWRNVNRKRKKERENEMLNILNNKAVHNHLSSFWLAQKCSSVMQEIFSDWKVYEMILRCFTLFFSCTDTLVWLNRMLFKSNTYNITLWQCCFKKDIDNISPSILYLSLSLSLSLSFWINILLISLQTW